MVTIDSSEKLQRLQRIRHGDEQRDKGKQERENILDQKQRCRPLNVVDHAAALRHNGRQAGKIRFQQYQLGHLAGGLGTGCHGNTAVRILQGQHIVHAVARHRNGVAIRLQCFHEFALLGGGLHGQTPCRCARLRQLFSSVSSVAAST